MTDFDVLEVTSDVRLSLAQEFDQLADEGLRLVADQKGRQALQKIKDKAAAIINKEE